MLDPDAPSRANPTEASWLHWLVVNVPGESGLVGLGDALAPYVGPCPAEGTEIHSYSFCLLQQPGTEPLPFAGERRRGGAASGSASRRNFDLKAFRKKHNLGTVLGFRWMQSAHDDYCPVAHRLLASGAGGEGAAGGAIANGGGGSGSKGTAPAPSVMVRDAARGFDARVAELGLELPPAPEPKGCYKPAVISGNHLYLSGHGPMRPDGSYVAGRVGAPAADGGLTVAEGKANGRLTGLAALASMRAALGTLDRVVRVVKTLGMVNAAPSLGQLECVECVNGFSELMRDVFGADRGVGARSAVGMATLPMNIPIEVEIILEIDGI